MNLTTNLSFVLPFTLDSFRLSFHSHLDFESLSFLLYAYPYTVFTLLINVE